MNKVSMNVNVVKIDANGDPISTHSSAAKTLLEKLKTIISNDHILGKISNSDIDSMLTTLSKYNI